MREGLENVRQTKASTALLLQQPVEASDLTSIEKQPFDCPLCIYATADSSALETTALGVLTRNMLSLPTALLSLVLWAGSLPHLAEPRCFGEDTLFERCNCVCYEAEDAQCGRGRGQHIQCDFSERSECPDGSELFPEFPSLNLDAPNPNITCL